MNQEEQNLEKQTSQLFLELYRQFPDLDLQCSRLAGSEVLSITLPDETESAVEVRLGENPEQAVFEAIFALKSLLQRFDD